MSGLLSASHLSLYNWFTGSSSGVLKIHFKFPGDKLIIRVPNTLWKTSLSFHVTVVSWPSSVLLSLWTRQGAGCCEQWSDLACPAPSAPGPAAQESSCPPGLVGKLLPTGHSVSRGQRGARVDLTLPRQELAGDSPYCHSRKTKSPSSPRSRLWSRVTPK